mgnify:CR=1 FL=1
MLKNTWFLFVCAYSFSNMIKMWSSCGFSFFSHGNCLWLVPYCVWCKKKDIWSGPHQTNIKKKLFESKKKTFRGRRSKKDFQWHLNEKEERKQALCMYVHKRIVVFFSNKKCVCFRRWWKKKKEENNEK